LNRLDVRRALMEYAVTETALQLEVARQYPDIQWNPGYSFDEGHHKFAIGPSLTLPVLNRNQGPIAEARARREEAAARFTALQAQAISEMEKGLAQYHAALAELTQAETQLVPLQQRREKAARRALEIGEADRLALAGIRVQGVVAARARLEALRKAQAALGALEDALQHPTQAGIPVLPGRKP
jgi:outer membrane protein TolC